MHGAVAATEVVCDASRKLVANAMHCKTTRQQAPRGCGWTAICVVLLLSVLETDEKKRECRVWEYSEQSVSRFSDLGWRSGFSLSSAKQLVKSASACLSAFRLLPRLEGGYMRRAHSHASRHASQKSGLPTRTWLRWCVKTVRLEPHEGVLQDIFEEQRNRALRGMPALLCTLRFCHAPPTTKLLPSCIFTA